MRSQYIFLPEFYDILNSSVDYSAWASSIDLCLKKHGVKNGSLLLDLACGTGSISIPLAALGYDVIGIDASPEMLMKAREKSAEAGADILWLCQDMRTFELYGTVGAIICCLDSLNYLLKTKDIEACFRLVCNYLDPGGIFVFDVNTPYKFKEIFAKSDFIIEEDGVYCGWQNAYDEKSRICEFSLSIFAKHGNEYKRCNEHQRERCYSMKTLTSALASAGLELLSVSSSLEGESLTPETERWFFICKKPEQPSDLILT